MDNLHPSDSTNTAPTDPANPLWHYVQSLDHGAIDRLSHPASDDVKQVMAHHIHSLLGQLPPEEFHVAVTTDREHLGHLLSAAMMNGYFLRAAEQRMAFENLFQEPDSTTGSAASSPSTQA